MWVIATCLAAILSILLMRIGVQYSVSEFMNSFHSVHYVATITGSDSMNDIISIGRSTTSYDVSSGRTDSFNKALSLYTFKPIFGVGKENIVVGSNESDVRAVLPHGDGELVNGKLVANDVNGGDGARTVQHDSVILKVICRIQDRSDIDVIDQRIAHAITSPASSASAL